MSPINKSFKIPRHPPIFKILKHAHEVVAEQPKYSPYDHIARILDEKPPLCIVSVDQLLAIYAAGSVRVKKDETRIKEGLRRITNAYDLTMNEFEMLGKKDPCKIFRKDGQTPLVAHSSRVPLIGAYLGAGSHQISSLLLHDCPEDCSTPIGRIQSLLSKRVAMFVALLTKPKLVIREGKNGSETHEWVHMINDAKRWERIKDVERPEYYEERLKTHFAEMLNTRVVPPEMKLKAHFYKLAADSLDSLVTDSYLDPIKARIRCAILISEIRHLEITGPTLRSFFIDLLRKRGFDISDTKSPRIVPDKKVIECHPIAGNLNVHILDGLPAPNGYIIVYIDDQMKAAIANRKFKSPIRIELPHNAPADSDISVQSFLNTLGLAVRCEPGESLLPWANDASGRHVLIRGINSSEKYQNLLTYLASFYHAHLAH